MIYNKDIAQMTAINLVELLKNYGIYSCIETSLKPLKEFNGYESKKARNIGHTDAINISVGNKTTEFFVLEDGTLMTGTTFMSEDAISHIIFEYTEEENPIPEIFWENGVTTYQNPEDDESGAIFTTIPKLREWFGKWKFIDDDSYEREKWLPF